MKCEHCGKNEVTFVYRSNINGKVEEKHLCAECAEKLGYSRRLAENRARMRTFLNGGFFGLPGGNSVVFGLPVGTGGEGVSPMEDASQIGSFWDGFFTPSLMGQVFENPFDDFFSDMPALTAVPRSDRSDRKEADHLVEREEQGQIDRQRRLNALRMEMRRAVDTEDFERAARLRDEIRSLEDESGQA